MIISWYFDGSDKSKQADSNSLDLEGKTERIDVAIECSSSHVLALQLLK